MADAVAGGFSDVIVSLHAIGGRSHMVWWGGLGLIALGGGGMAVGMPGFRGILGWFGIIAGIGALIPDPVGLMGALASAVSIMVTSVVLARSEQSGL